MIRQTLRQLPGKRCISLPGLCLFLLILFTCLPQTSRSQAQPGQTDRNAQGSQNGKRAQPGQASQSDQPVQSGSFAAARSNKTGFSKDYHFLHSSNRVADKNFYLLTVIDQTPAIRNVLTQDTGLKRIHDRLITVLKNHVSDTCTWPATLVSDFCFSSADSQMLNNTLQECYRKNTSLFDRMIDQHLRPSGYYQRFATLSNEELFLRAWEQYYKGINYIIDQFGLGKKMRYPRIDSANYDVNSRYYRTALKDMFADLSEQTEAMEAWYHPSLAIAMELMDLNDRDEPARFEPLETGENKAAIERIRRTDWAKYAYTAIVIPGNGPELTTTPISPINKIHCAVAARRYLKGMAPFLIVSGGYCYPFRGPYCEAIEMKKFLMTRFGIPADVILIDPHARHTTTNIRNADRLIIRYGIPMDRPALFVTSKSQAGYSADASFDQRNLRELGYLPYRDKRVVSIHDISFYPVMESLHMDPYDPLDP